MGSALSFIKKIYIKNTSPSQKTGHFFPFRRLQRVNLLPDNPGYCLFFLFSAGSRRQISRDFARLLL
jgi:hypothetical protein